MVEVPADVVTQADMVEWYRLQEELRKVKAKEMLLRTKIFGFYFPSPKEGTNSYKMPDGYTLKGVHTITREVDQGAFQALREKLVEAGVRPDDLVQWKPSLKIKNYRELTAEQLHLFDQCLIVKPGSPSLEIVLAKKGG